MADSDFIDKIQAIISLCKNENLLRFRCDIKDFGAVEFEIEKEFDHQRPYKEPQRSKTRYSKWIDGE